MLKTSIVRHISTIRGMKRPPIKPTWLTAIELTLLMEPLHIQPLTFTTLQVLTFTDSKDSNNQESLKIKACRV